MVYRQMCFVLLNNHFFVMTVVLVEQNTELGQLRQALEQLREEKAKETGRPDKLAEELNGKYTLVIVNAEVVSFLDGTM